MDVSFFAGAVLGFAMYYLMSKGSNKRSDKKAMNTKNFLGKLIPSAKFRINDYEIHIHHWVYLSTILLFGLLFFRELLLKYAIVLGFLSGGIIEGLLYKDRFQLFKKI